MYCWEFFGVKFENFQLGSAWGLCVGCAVRASLASRDLGLFTRNTSFVLSLFLFFISTTDLTTKTRWS